jgi:hypothetical protein
MLFFKNYEAAVGASPSFVGALSASCFPWVNEILASQAAAKQ